MPQRCPGNPVKSDEGVAAHRGGVDGCALGERHDDEAVFSRPAHPPGLELVSVAYRERVFPEHSHAEWVFGAIETGAEMLVTDGIRHEVREGEVLRLALEQPHANSSLGPEILRYRVAYIPEATLAPYLDEETDWPGFGEPVVTDAAVHATFVAAHRQLGSADSQRLEQESAIAVLAQAMFGGHTGPRPAKRPERRAVAAARAYIDEHYATGFGLGTLSGVARLSVFHLSRTFQSVGLSPLAYRNQRRLVEAKRLLLAGQPIADVALAVGYADQSHLTRQFQRIVGVSPARYART